VVSGSKPWAVIGDKEVETVCDRTTDRLGLKWNA